MPDRLAVERILVVELWNIGDVVLTIPFLSQLRSRFPGAKVSLLCQPHARELLAGTGLVDEFIEANLSWARTGTIINPIHYPWREFSRAVLALRRRRFDLAFQNRQHLRERILLGLSGAKRRLGFAAGSGTRLLTDPLPATTPDRHRTAEWLSLLEPFGTGPTSKVHRLHVQEAERRSAEDFLRARGVSSDDILVGIHPGASIAAKRWPLDRFVDVARNLAARPAVRVLTFVDPVGYGAELGKVNGAISAKVGLREMIALLERCDVVVCNDSGPMHVAGALGVPTVAIFGSRISQWFAPLGEGHETVSAAPDEFPGRVASRAPGGDVSEVPTSRVLSAIERVLGKGTSGRPLTG